MTILGGKTNPTNQLYSFKGRNGRGSYWIIWVIGIVLSYIMDEVPSRSTELTFIVIIIILLEVVNYLWTCAAMLVKRCRDVNNSGWWAFLILIPIIGQIWAFIQLGLIKGKSEVNKYDIQDPNPISAFSNLTKEQPNCFSPDKNLPPPLYQNSSPSGKKSKFWLWVLLGNVGIIIVIVVFGIISVLSAGRGTIESALGDPTSIWFRRPWL